MVDKQQNDPMIGTILNDRFEIIEFIASGGMGTVYKAIQRPLGRLVAIKLLSTDLVQQSQFRARFFLEACLSARLCHPNTIRIFDYGNDGETYFIAMELLRGRSVSRMLRAEGPQPPLRVIDIIAQLCPALTEAHEAHVVHRDLKLSNLFLIHFSEQQNVKQDFVKILDFGLAKWNSRPTTLSQKGKTFGSPLFMAPEQVRGKEIDGRADIYSIGICMFALLTGKYPFHHNSATQILLDHIQKRPPTCAEKNPAIQVPKPVEEIIQRCLRKKPQDRFQNTLALEHALQECRRVLSPISNTSTLSDYSNDIALIPTQPFEAPSEGNNTIRIDVDLFEEESNRNTNEFEDPKELALIQEMDLSDYIAYIDFNCPFCFALHERITRWGLQHQIQWRLVKHASHVYSPPFSAEQETLLTEEISSLKRSAPDINISLPPRRCESSDADLLSLRVEKNAPLKAPLFRQKVFQALWQEGKDIGSRETLASITRELDLPESIFDESNEANKNLEQSLNDWQTAWEQGPYDFSIPIITHLKSERTLIGLPTEKNLVEFFLQKRSKLLNTSVCYFQRRPVVVIGGRLERMWNLVSDLRSICEIVHAPSSSNIEAHIHNDQGNDLILIDPEGISLENLIHLGDQCRKQKIPWAIATPTPSPEQEIVLLSAGAAEYLPIRENTIPVAKARINRILAQRAIITRELDDARPDLLTTLPTRRHFVKKLTDEWNRALRTQTPISLILANIDAFKVFNRLYGYLKGDRILEKIGVLFQSSLSNNVEIAARFSGDQFIFIVSNANREKALFVASELHKLVSSQKIDYPESRVSPYLSLSMGVSTVIPDSNSTIHVLMDRLEIALERSQKNGRNQIAYA